MQRGVHTTAACAVCWPLLQVAASCQLLLLFAMMQGHHIDG